MFGNVNADYFLGLVVVVFTILMVLTTVVVVVFTGLVGLAGLGIVLSNMHIKIISFFLA